MHGVCIVYIDWHKRLTPIGDLGAFEKTLFGFPLNYLQKSSEITYPVSKARIDIFQSGEHFTDSVTEVIECPPIYPSNRLIKLLIIYPCITFPTFS